MTDNRITESIGANIDIERAEEIAERIGVTIETWWNWDESESWVCGSAEEIAKFHEEFGE